MKFKDDGSGWRDLLVSGEYGDEFNVHVDTQTKGAFVSCKEDGKYAAVHLSRRQLRTIANKILKELNR